MDLLSDTQGASNDFLYLQGMQERKVLVWIYLDSGTRLIGFVVGHGRDHIFLARTPDGIPMMVNKEFVVTVMPATTETGGPIWGAGQEPAARKTGAGRR